MVKKTIIEKELGIKGDYQFKALKNGNFLQSNWHANKLSVIEYLLNKYQPQTVLDLGAGSGNLELTFAPRLKKIVTVDYNDDAVNFLKKQLKQKKFSNVTVKQSDLRNVSNIEKLGKFDLIIMVDVLEHLEHPVSDKLITAFKKMLNKNGVVVIITPNYRSLWPFMERFVDRFTSIPDLGHCQHVSHFNPVNIQQIFRKQHFKTKELKTFNTYSFIAPKRQISAWLCRTELELGFTWGNLLLGVFSI